MFHRFQVLIIYFPNYEELLEIHHANGALESFLQYDANHRGIKDWPIIGIDFQGA